VRTIKHFADSIFSIIHFAILQRIEIEIYARQFSWDCGVGNSVREHRGYWIPRVAVWNVADSSIIFIKHRKNFAIFRSFLKNWAEK
jgi:hypothetical protein